jgi:DNA polymerase elongation subunit (family B)
MQFYTSVNQRSNNILLCGYSEGKRFKQKIHFKPYLFIPSKKYSKYRTIEGHSVSRMDFESIRDCRNFIQQYKDVDNFEVYGSTNFANIFINDWYKKKEYDSSLIRTAFLDIEVSTEHGYPDIQLAQSSITAITMMYKDVTFVFGYGDYKASDSTVKYIKCKDEIELLNRFLKLFSHDVYRPDVVSGWNIEFFDIPYCINRIINLLGENYAKKLSPFNILEQKTIEYMGNELIGFTPIGINILDYMHLYKKFTYSQQESYKLDHIAYVELNERKLDYSEYGSLHNLYCNDHQKFIEYNIRDCLLIHRLEMKMKLLELVYTIAYDSKINFIEALATVRSWDTVIHNYLFDQNIVVPNPARQDTNRQPVGAYVKDPQRGAFSWVTSFDITSLYPHLIRSYNISPDTFQGKLGEHMTVDQLLEGAMDKHHPFLDENNLSVAANGCLFLKNKQGFLPALMQQLFDKRKEAKNEMLKKQSELAMINAELTRREDRRKGE